ncbi:hypothetical protein [Pedobacter frigidisoli]|uniref:hypothetical protein n=1 Tax=Pedobacter frigidisoli TaxID=2530455 RepID=UPI00292D5DCF|nr:hypothetical protein [Pedobacter frigidisoli]
MNKLELSEEFAKILVRYFSEFNLEPIDVAHLINTKKEVIERLLSGESTVVHYTLEQIAQIFGLRYFKFGDPETPLPSYESLPDSTKDRIELRLREGPSVVTKYNPSKIYQHMSSLLSAFKIGERFLATNMAELIFKEYGIKYKPSDIIIRLNTSFKDFVEKTGEKEVAKKGPGAKPEYYRLVKIFEAE